MMMRIPARFARIHGTVEPTASLNIKYISHQFEYENVLNGSQIVAIGLLIVASSTSVFGNVLWYMWWHCLGRRYG